MSFPIVLRRGIFLLLFNFYNTKLELLVLFSKCRRRFFAYEFEKIILFVAVVVDVVVRRVTFRQRSVYNKVTVCHTGDCRHLVGDEQ